MPEKNWRVAIDMQFRGVDYKVAFTSSESAILSTLRGYYTMVDERIDDIASAAPGSLPPGFVGDFRVLLRCLVMNRLEVHSGKFVEIQKS
jgi:hypothetical protein